MPRMFRVACLLPVWIAAVVLAMPSAALPCLATHCAQAQSAADDPADHACCPGCAGGATDTPSPNQDNRSHGDGIPCDCPPGCPAPCGSGKPPCPPIEAASTVDSMAPLGAPAGPPPAAHVDVTPEGVFHPPRI